MNALRHYLLALQYFTRVPVTGRRRSLPITVHSACAPVRLTFPALARS